MKKILIWLLISSMLFVGCSSKAQKEASSQAAEEMDKANQEIVYVKTEPVKMMNFNNLLSIPGTLKPKEEAVVTAKVNGVVESIHADLGSKVQNGDLLCKIDDKTYRLQYENSQTLLNTQKMEYEQLEKEYNRMKALFENQAVSKSEFERIENDLKIKKETLHSTENAITLAKQSLDDANIKATISGVISEKTVLKGQNLGFGERLFKIINMDKLYVEIGVSEKDIAFIQKGQEAVVKVDIFSNLFKGKITNIGPEPDQQTKTYPIKILLDNENNKLKPGMFATVEITTDTHKDVLAVCKEAVFKENEKNYLYIVKDKKAVKKEVKIGYSNDQYYEIIEGVNKDDSVIMVGVDQLEDGSMVEVK